MIRLHITGSPRSGTSLMLELMITGFNIDAYNKNEVSVLALPPASETHKLYCSKNPNEWYLTPKLLQQDPNQWIIFMQRDPRDVVVSKHQQRPNRYWTNLRLWQLSWTAIQSCLEHPRLVILRYEDLVNNPDAVQDRLSQHLPFLEKKQRFSEFHQFSQPSEQLITAMNGLRPINNHGVGSWHRHKARLAGQLQLHGDISETLISLGYEKDRDWLDQLKGVTPDTKKGVWPDIVDDNDRQQQLNQLDQRLRDYLQARGLDV